MYLKEPFHYAIIKNKLKYNHNKQLILVKTGIEYEYKNFKKTFSENFCDSNYSYAPFLHYILMDRNAKLKAVGNAYYSRRFF